MALAVSTLEISVATLVCPTFRFIFYFLTAFEIGLRFLIKNANPKNEILKKICTYPTIEKTVFFHEISCKNDRNSRKVGSFTAAF
jgi:hypothetical protein